MFSVAFRKALVALSVRIIRVLVNVATVLAESRFTKTYTYML